jgi:hypothetical protein
MSLAIPPLYDAIIDEEKKANLNWTIFFQNLSDGDAGNVWTPTFVNLGVTGSPTYSGRYYQISQYLTYFKVLVTPNGGTSTSTAGSTYIDNFPIAFGGDGIVFAVSGNLGDGPGHIVASSNRIYVPAWAAVAIPLTVIGICEVV